MKVTLVVLLLSLVVVPTYPGCLAAQSPAPGFEVKTGTIAPSIKPGWEQEWQKLLADGQKEGKVSLYASWPPEARTALTETVKNRFGILLEFSPYNNGSEMIAKVNAEQRAGLYVADLFGGGIITLIAGAKPAGILGPAESLIILPEAKDAKYWSGGAFPFSDKDKTTISFSSSIQRYVMVNTDLISKDEITTYEDLLKPQFKGKITLQDPSAPGTGNGFMAHLALQVWDPEKARQFLIRLVKQQEAVIQRDKRIHIEMVAKGKYAIALAPSSDTYPFFLSAGAPLDFPVLKEPTFVSPSAGAIGVATKFANPNAAKVFLNWLLTKEGQTVFSKASGMPSQRMDVPTEGFHPVLLPRPGEKLIMQDEEFTLFMGKMQETAKQVIDEASR